VEQLKTADGGMRSTRLYEQLDDCEFFDAVVQVKLSALYNVSASYGHISSKGRQKL